jgi:hypothetical protein
MTSWMSSDLNPVHRAVSDLCGRDFQGFFDVLWTMPLRIFPLVWVIIPC